MRRMTEDFREIVEEQFEFWELLYQPEPVSFASAAALSLIRLPATWLMFHQSEFRFAASI